MQVATPFAAVEDLDAAGTLALAEAVTRQRRALEVADLETALHWADLHGWEPAPAAAGGNVLVRLGGEGTPLVQDLSICELAVARGVHTLAARAHLADALDLRHRLPLVLKVLREDGGEVWVARKVASMTRKLDPEAVAVVDRAVAAACAGESLGRVLSIAEAKVIAADTPAARAEREARRRERYVALTRTDEHGLRTIIARVSAGDAVWVDAMVERVADALDLRRGLIPDVPANCGREELRSVALGWLAHPEDVVALLAGEADPRGRGSASKHVVLHVHLHPDGAVARVEEIGPTLVEEVTALVGHARITVAPVIDLNTGRSVNAYEHPEDVKARTHLRCVGDVFPHANQVSRRVDVDHPDPYQSTGPPGQTGDDNAAPLGRRHHRAKTHLAYRCVQTGPGEYVWQTPHGLNRLVDGTGTHEIDAAQAFELTHPGALDAALDRVEASLRSPVI